MRAVRASAALLLLLAASPGPAALQGRGNGDLSQIQVVLRVRVPSSGAPPELTADGEPFRASAALPCFYERRAFSPAWSGGSGLLPHAYELTAALAAAGEHGLRTEDYPTSEIRRRIALLPRSVLPPPEDLAELDLLLTHAFLAYGAHLRDGRVNPRAVQGDCALQRTEEDLAAVLEGALSAGRVRQALEALAPPHPGYQALRQELANLREAAARGDEPAALDPSRVEEVQAFQLRHGLEPDGVVGPATLRALNVPAADRVRQIELNLERWRWLPRDPGGRHVMVNVAGFELAAVEDGRTALSMRIIVGKTYQRTPLFTSAMTQVVLNPSWHVPASITSKEIVPRLKRDPGYLARQGFYWSNGRLIQRPGPQNALGRIKFLFPNRFNVYLHDTPSRSLFERTVRTFSHGCMRVEKPLELARWVLGWTPETLEAALATRRERSIPLPVPLPVHVAYWTAWVDGEGVLQLREDVYGRDEALRKALGKR
jgi:murein L,D-transpeptidase YcbB/YkuD